MLVDHLRENVRRFNEDKSKKAKKDLEAELGVVRTCILDESKLGRVSLNYAFSRATFHDLSHVQNELEKFCEEEGNPLDRDWETGSYYP